jgi:hypothetical protein|tara:strand:+ start:3561 stop:3878 length:318 start_codon:yes stop_codon:yes gene_type:complete
MNLIVVSSLTCDEGLFFRYITMMGKTEMGYNVLVEAKKNQIDKYYNKLKSHGWYDYVDDFILPEWAEEGVRIDKEPNYPRTIVTKKISCENSLNILGQMKFLKKL